MKLFIYFNNNYFKFSRMSLFVWLDTQKQVKMFDMKRFENFQNSTKFSQRMPKKLLKNSKCWHQPLFWNCFQWFSATEKVMERKECKKLTQIFFNTFQQRKEEWLKQNTITENKNEWIWMWRKIRWLKKNKTFLDEKWAVYFWCQRNPCIWMVFLVHFCRLYIWKHLVCNKLKTQKSKKKNVVISKTKIEFGKIPLSWIL